MNAEPVSATPPLRVPASSASARELHLAHELAMAQAGRAVAESRAERAIQIICDLRARVEGAERRADLFIGAIDS